MSRTNLTSAGKSAARRAAPRRAMAVWLALLLPAIAAGAVWLTSASHFSATPQAAPAVAAAPAPQTPAPVSQTMSAEPMLGPGGAVGIAVPEELQTFMVATRLPDGRIVLEHATGPKAAQAKTRAGAKARKTAVKE